VIALAGAALLFIPAVIFIRLDARPLNHYRSFVVLAGLVWLVLLSMRNRSRLIGDLARGA